ncbi:MAG: LrgB family protein [Chloroflexaceae bacterium]|nr:LrgB family protein [Chloroflexaceae bacterium]
MQENITDIWVYLAQTPLLWLTLTLLVYLAADWLYQRAGRLPLLNPVLLAIVVLVLVLMGTRTPYDTYFAGAQFVHFLLGPATVALAIPLYTYYARLKKMLLPLVGALLIGSATGVLSAVWIGQALDLPRAVLLSLAPKSITTPIAMGISEQVGGIPSLTAVLVILTGMIGALLGNELLTLLRFGDNSVRGFAIGLASHGLGTARALQIHAEAGAFAGLAMGLNGATTAILVPLLVQWLGL